MIKCPECAGQFESFTVTGPLVWGDVPVKNNRRGLLVAVGPVKPSTTIKAGQELKGKNLKIICPNCGYTGPVAKFASLVQCALTGQWGHQLVYIQVGDDRAIPVLASHAEVARAVFTRERLLGTQDAAVEDIVSAAKTLAKG